MASKSKVKRTVKKAVASPKAKAPSAARSIVSAGVSMLSGGGGAPAKAAGARRRSRGKSPNYWANKVLVAKLKKKYYRIQFGGMR